MNLGDGHRHRGDDQDECRTQQGDRNRLTLVRVRNPTCAKFDIRLAADLRPHHEQQHAERCDADATGGAGATASYEHEHIGQQQGFRMHCTDIERIESTRARHHSGEKAQCDELSALERAHGCRVR